MSIILNSGYLSSAEAAKQLGVSQHQIAMLAKRDELAYAMISGVLLIDPLSLRMYSKMRCGKGRPWSSEMSWAALWLLSGLDAPWLSSQQRQRLSQRLSTISSKELVWSVRKRAGWRVFTAKPEQLPSLRQELVLGGKSTDRPDIFGMPRNDVEVEGYLPAAEVDALVSKYALQSTIAGNLFIHTVVDIPWERDERFNRQMPVAVVAADLAASLDSREAKAGLAALDILLGTVRRG